MVKIKAGLLLFYLKLYDEVMPDLREKFVPFISSIKGSLEAKGIDVFTSRICRVKSEFTEALAGFEAGNMDVIITLHLAYSPSLESAEALKNTKIPIVVFDTTLKNDFSVETTGDDIMANHGIHGVQDMCNVLIKNEKRFLITTGYYKDEQTLEDLYSNIVAAKLLRKFTTSKVGSLGGPFNGMGDFFVEKERLFDSLGIKVIETGFKDISGLMPGYDNKALCDEVDLDKASYNITFKDNKIHIDSNRIGLAIRKWIYANNFDAFTMNFSILDKSSGWPTIPFLEASKSMESGIGYAGEGDALTAAFTGALLSVFKKTTFTEMFCPDWKNDLIFLSHMGEINPCLLAGKPDLVAKDLSFIKVKTPAFVAGQLKSGKACFINLAPSKYGYVLIICPVEMIELKNTIPQSLSGWFKPQVHVKDFLKVFSQEGGTHHSALVYIDDNECSIIEKFGCLAGMKTVLI